jgi:hypothetical protein
MNSTRKDFGTTVATLARLYKEAESRGDTRRAKVYARAVDVLLDAWPADPEPARRIQDRSELQRLRSFWQQEKTLVGIGCLPRA